MGQINKKDGDSMRYKPSIIPQDISKLILEKFPTAKVIIEEVGVEPNAPDIKRYILRFNELNTPIEFRLGYNLLFLIDGKPTKAIQHMPLSGSGRGLTLGGVHIKGEFDDIREWLDNISKYIQPAEVPKVNEIARKCLGKEEKVEVRKEMVIIYYDVFFVIITPHTGSFYKNKGNRLLHLGEFDSEPVDKFFRLAKDYAHMVRTGQL